MKAAVLIQGEPRFCHEFDTFVNRISDYTEIDWFFYLWDKSPETSFLAGGNGHQVVAPYWQDLTKEKAIDKLRQNLPVRHNIIRLELGDQNLVVHAPITENFAKETVQENVWKMWNSQYQVNKFRVEHEQKNNFKYDLVIKTRPDVGLLSDVSLEKIKNWLTDRPNKVLMPHNRACGYGVHSCDLFAIASSDNMTTYCDVYNQALSHHNAGVIFHPETMIAKHLERNGLHFETYLMNIALRDFGTWIDLGTNEKFTSQNVRTWNNHIYISNFADWS